MKNAAVTVLRTLLPGRSSLRTGTPFYEFILGLNTHCCIVTHNLLRLTKNVLRSLSFCPYANTANLWRQYTICILHKIPTYYIGLFPRRFKHTPKPLVTNNEYHHIFSLPAPSCGRAVSLRYMWLLVVSFFEYAINTSEQFPKLLLRSLWIGFRAPNRIRFAVLGSLYVRERAR
jgi:hypothetical protein